MPLNHIRWPRLRLHASVVSMTKRKKTEESTSQSRRSLSSGGTRRQQRPAQSVKFPVVGEAIDPTRQPWPGMPMGVDVGMDITGNPAATPHANAGGPSSTKNIVGSGRPAQASRGGQRKPVSAAPDSL